MVILQQYCLCIKDGNRQTWVVTGWDDSVFENKKETTSSDAAAVYDANSATSEGATRSRSNTDEVVSVTQSVARPAENVKKLTFLKVLLLMYLLLAILLELNLTEHKARGMLKF